MTTRGVSTFGMHTAPALIRTKANRPAQAAIRAAQRGDPRRRFISTAGAVAFSLLFLANCMMTVNASGFSLFRKPGVTLRRKASLGLSITDCLSLRCGDIEQSDIFNFEPKPTPPIEFAHGTTTLSFVFQGGIVAAVDSRAR